MLKYVESAVTFSEFPNEIALCVDISGCPNKCPDCSEAYLAEDVGTILDEQEIDNLIAKNPGITLFGFMGGDNDHQAVGLLTDYIQVKHHLKVGMYSGRDYINLSLADRLDYYKYGGWRKPSGLVTDWPKKSWGPLCFPFSNQRVLKRQGNIMIDITDEFRKEPIQDLSSKIL